MTQIFNNGIFANYLCRSLLCQLCHSVVIYNRRSAPYYFKINLRPHAFGNSFCNLFYSLYKKQSYFLRCGSYCAFYFNCFGYGVIRRSAVYFSEGYNMRLRCYNFPANYVLKCRNYKCRRCYRVYSSFGRTAMCVLAYNFYCKFIERAEKFALYNSHITQRNFTSYRSYVHCKKSVNFRVFQSSFGNHYFCSSAYFFCRLEYEFNRAVKAFFFFA